MITNFINEYPYTNLTYANIDWLIKKVKELSGDTEDTDAGIQAFLSTYANEYPYSNLTYANIDWLIKNVGGLDSEVTKLSAQMETLQADVNNVTNKLGDKVDKLNVKNNIYVTDGSTPPKTTGIQYLESPLEGTIPIRDGIGSLQVPTAQDATQAVNKGQMDTALNGKVDKTTDPLKFYGTDSNGEPYFYQQESSAVAWTVPLRNGNGALVAANPTQNNELATKEYVDNLVQQGSGGSTENGVFTNSVTVGDPDANSTGGTNTVITATSIDMWSRAGGEELTITLGNDPNVYYRNRGQTKYGSANFEDIVNVANAYIGSSSSSTPFTVANLNANTVEVQNELILKSPNGNKYKITVDNTGALSTTQINQ